MRLTLLSLLFFSLLAAEPAEAKSDAQKFIDSQLKTDPLFCNAVVGILAVDQNGNTIAEWNSNLPLLTASTLKTVTTGLGLYYLGPAYRFCTRIAYSGQIRDSVLQGNLHIIGGGDPTLGSQDTVAYKIDSIFGIWKNAVDACGIKKIEGNIVVDDRFFEREAIPDSWSWGNISTDYGSAPSGLSFYENNQIFKLIPGEQPGDSVSVSISYPGLPDFQIVNELKTAKAKSGDRSAYYTQDMVQAGRFTGTVPADRDSILSVNSNKFPHLSCGYEFREYLLRHGIAGKPQIVDISQMREDEDEALIYIAQTYSPELRRIVNVTNHISNNFYAETILKTIGKKMTGSGSYDSSVVAVRRLLKELNVPLTGFTMEDGSGLSRQNYVSPAFFCNYYSKIAESDIFVPFFESLPVPGEGGTLKNVLRNAPVQIKNRIHAKSGSLANVKCYAGYVECGGESGLIRFAILVNNYAARTSQIQPKIEGFLEMLTHGE